MKQILIGTCIPGNYAAQWLPSMVEAGFECFSINFHMGFHDIDPKENAKQVKDILAESGKTVSTLGCYTNPLMYEEHVRELERAIDSASLYGAKNVSTFAGAIEGKSVEYAMPRFKEVFTELCKRAEDKGVRICIENCPMDGYWNYCTCNIGINPKAWEMMFDAVPSDALGLEWEPAHQMIQLIDPIPQLRKWAKKVYHMHGKDATVDWHAVSEYGAFNPVNDFAPQRTPGFGDTDWRIIFSILRANGFEGDVCVEGYHDPVYSGELEMTGQLHALKYLNWCRGGDYTPNPW
ncbi:MAG: sugar phosphate isomerase/epimerase family protein [Christensenellales bacterium]|jgi:sugar phosphate isomerase/epimerase